MLSKCSTLKHARRLPVRLSVPWACRWPELLPIARLSVQSTLERAEHAWACIHQFRSAENCIFVPRTQFQVSNAHKTPIVPGKQFRNIAWQQITHIQQNHSKNHGIYPRFIKFLTNQLSQDPTWPRGDLLAKELTCKYRNDMHTQTLKAGLDPL